MFHDRLGCSSISFRHLDLAKALQTIAEIGFAEIDLGALPGVCDHVPFVLDLDSVAAVTETVTASGLRVRSVNGDIGDLNRPLTLTQRAARRQHLDRLLTLTAGIGARALVLPCGALDHRPHRTLEQDLDTVAAELGWAAGVARKFGVEIWTESLHVHRLCCYTARAAQLTARLPAEIKVVMDFSHIVASGGDPVRFVGLFGDRIAHVHLRDAVPGNINLGIGNGDVDFAAGLSALAISRYTGHFSLELETRDITNEQRPATAAHAARLISPLIP